MTGKGVEQDYNRAFELYTLAAEQETPAAYYGLGYLYEHGYGIEQNRDKAIEYYILADERNYEPAKEALQSLQDSN